MGGAGSILHCQRGCSVGQTTIDLGTRNDGAKDSALTLSREGGGGELAWDLEG